MKKQVATAIAVLAVLSCTVAMADWNGGGHVMDDNGVQWPTGSEDIMVDVGAKDDIMLADDWVYSGTGPVRDAHLWISWHDDYVGNVTQVHLALYENDGGMPGTEVWYGKFTPDDNPNDDIADGFYYNPVPWSTGPDDDVWVNPFAPDLGPASTDLTDQNPTGLHGDVYQINIPDLTAVANIPDPTGGSLQLDAGETYWLGAVITIVDDDLTDSETPWLGWHTSQTGTTNNYAAMWLDSSDPNNPVWSVIDQNTSYDLAFVMTPEPSALALLLLTGMSVATRRRRRH